MNVKGRKALKKIEPYKPGKPIDEVKRELQLEDVVKLASNENPMAPSPKAIEAISREAGNVNRYPDGGCFYLRQALSKKLGVQKNNIVFGNGSDEIIIMALRAFSNSGDEVIVSEPTFAIYRIASMVEETVIRTIPRKKDYEYDLDAILNAVTSKTRIIFIANPDNPTGVYVKENDLNRFIEKVPENVLIFIDEAYYEFARGSGYPETLKLIECKDKNVIIARTFSKAYGLAGLRIGYAVAREDIAGVLNKVREPFNVNSLAQAAARAALEDQGYVDGAVDLVKEEKKRLYEALDSCGVKYIPSLTNFVLINTNRDSKAVFEYLLKKGVIVRDMSAWGINDAIRVSLGLKEENDKFIRAFSKALQEIPENQ
ncbi:MAG: histidinol-phosphate transaminase [Candidatus Omnitrophota bacterium]